MTAVTNSNRSHQFQVQLCKSYLAAVRGEERFTEMLRKLEAPAEFQQKVLNQIIQLGPEKAFQTAWHEGWLQSVKQIFERRQANGKNESSLHSRAAGVPRRAKPKLHQMVQFHPFANKATQREIYSMLGSFKWMEYVDGEFRDFGPKVFDEGLHGGPKEPGFSDSMAIGYGFIRDHLGTRITPEYYLTLHKILCGHFKGKETSTLVDQRGVGTFRSTGDKICWVMGGPYYMTDKAVKEFLSIEPSLGRITVDERTLTMRMDYREMSDSEVAHYFRRFVAEYYVELLKAGVDLDARLTAVARLIQRLQWLHCVHDGSGRTDTALLNQLLTEAGFHPVLLDHPYLSSTSSLKQWKRHIIEGLMKWEAMVVELTASGELR